MLLARLEVATQHVPGWIVIPEWGITGTLEVLLGFDDEPCHIPL